jgi:putative ABC transport system permease protein
VRRRRRQTTVIGIVVALSTMMSVIALALLSASSGPFERAYDRQRGAHLIVTYDPGKVTAARLSQLTRRPGVTAAAGPFQAGLVQIHFGSEGPANAVSVVGRATPGGAVDRLNLWTGRWATEPGEIVLNQNPKSSYVEVGGTNLVGRWKPGDSVTVDGGPALKVVGLAFSLTGSADAWVTPGQLAALHPSATQMLFRFEAADTQAQLDADRTTVTAGLPAGAAQSSWAWLALKSEATGSQATFLPFLIVFGVLSLAVAVLIVANVISGAVVAGFRHIGILKSLGFTPGQVLGVYLAMVSVPAVAGSAIGTAVGYLAAWQLLYNTFASFGVGGLGVPIWVVLSALLGMPLLVALSALAPALRARSLPAAEAISAGSASRSGRGRWVQRRLSGTRLPRAVSLGLGLPFARPGRSGLTLAAVVIGVASVTFATGLAMSVTSYEHAAQRAGAVQVEVNLPPDGEGPAPAAGSDTSDAGDQAFLRSLPGVAHLTSAADVDAREVGSTVDTQVTFWRGDAGSLRFQVLKGRLPSGPGEVAVSERFLRRHGHQVGDTMVLQAGARQASVRIVGQLIYNTDQQIYSDWPTLRQLAPGQRADAYFVRLRPGAGVQGYLDQVRSRRPDLAASRPDDTDEFIATLLFTVTLLTLLLAAVSAVGVFNTVVLNATERRRDLGLLKSVGMTPGQVTVMLVTSMALLGAVGALVGVPLGYLCHRLVLPAMAGAAQVGMTRAMLHIYHPPLLAALALAGVVIAALGAYFPARSAARLTIAAVLHNE